MFTIHVSGYIYSGFAGSIPCSKSSIKLSSIFSLLFFFFLNASELTLIGLFASRPIDSRVLALIENFIWGILLSRKYSQTFSLNELKLFLQL